MVFHLVRDLCWRSWFNSIRHEQVCGCFFQHHASHRHSGLVYLPSRLFLWISLWQRPGFHSEFGVQPCRFREQDRILPCHLEFCQEVHPRKGRCRPPPMLRSPINLIIESRCRISKASRYLLLWPFSSSLGQTTLLNRVPDFPLKCILWALAYSSCLFPQGFCQVVTRRDFTLPSQANAVFVVSGQ